MIVVGIDPGAHGALAVLKDGQLLHAADMPSMTHQVGKARRTFVSAPLLADELSRWLVWGDMRACVERVHAMPQQGVASTFNFGLAYGTVLGVLGALRLSVTHVAPTTWKRAAGLAPGHNKDDARQLAINAFPLKADLFKRKKDHNRAEAALIARFGLTLE